MSGPSVSAIVALILILGGGTPLRAQAVPPTIDLGTLGGSSSHAFGVNRDGVVVGDSATSGNVTTHAFIWTQADGMVDIGTLGGTVSFAFGINDSGLVVGYSYLAGNSRYHPFVWTQATGMVDLGTLGGSSGAAQAVNDSGVVVGYSLTPDNRSHAFKWTQAGGMVDLGGLGGPNVGASAINGDGDIVGYSSITGFLDWHAVLWPHTGGMTDLGTLGGPSAVANGINDDLVVVGSATTVAGIIHAFRWTQLDGLLDLGTLGGLTSSAYAIDNSESIVGESDPASGPPHGFWRAQNGITTELVGLVDTFASATAVNDAGKVVGRSRSATGFVHATLWDLAGVDRLPPAVTCGTADGAWHRADVSIACTASDNDSGLANSADASFSLTTNISAGIETVNATTGSRSVCDRAGNCTAAGPISGNKVDKKPPSIAISSPSFTAYTLGQSVVATYSCSDGGSGIATCAGTVATGASVDTSTVSGAKTFTVDATDTVSNLANQSVAYSVAYNVCLLYDPLKAHSSGSTVPIKIQLCDISFANRSSVATTVTATGVFLISPNAPGILDDAGSANPDLNFRYDSTLNGGGYVFNLNLKGFGTGTYLLTFQAANDPTVHTVQFQVK